MTVSENLATIKANIEASCRRVGRNPNEITIIAVTKYVTIERANTVHKAGIFNLAENRLEGLKEKFHALNEQEINWHFIGTLQSKKVKKVINMIDYLHSLDRLSLAKELNKRSTTVVPCFLQVNTSGEASKHGLKPSEVHEFIEKLAEFEQIKVIGLMTMAPHSDDEQVVRQSFRTLSMLRDEIASKQLSYAPCHYLSMGMSQDYQLAIEEGATHVRIGTSLVGTEH